MRKSLAEMAEVRGVILITAVSMSKERRLSLKKANPVEVVVIHVVAVGFVFSWSWKDLRCTTWWRTSNEFL